ncbi:MAG TPA: site-specific integrase [Solirubrobacterales bacterium]|nr:site-specific integrase [Solirubrobacterales bacterium]
MSQFKRGDRWVAKFQRQGRQVWVPGGPWRTKAEARRAEESLRGLLDRGGAPESCAEFAARWLREWPREAVSTRRLYSRAARSFAAHFGEALLADVDRAAARAWALGVPRNLSKVVAAMYEDARDVGLVETDPFAGLRLPRAARATIAPPSLEELDRLLAACSVLGGYGPEFRALVEFCAWTGLRSSEVQALRWSDLEPERVRVRRARKDDGSYGPPKNGRERAVPLLERARVLDRVPRRAGSDLVFHTPRGLPLGKGSLHYHWKAVRDASGTSASRQAAGVRPIRFHDLRHFCATALLEAGASHFDVSVMLGHEDGGALVMSRYGHPSKDAARRRLLNLGRLERPHAGSRPLEGALA